jgi:hypothetical protein
VGALVDKSLVRASTAGDVTRYGLLETMRHYGAENLRAAGAADEVGRRHARHFADFLDEAAAGLERADEPRWVAAIEEEFDNIRAALRWTMRVEDTDLALRIAGALPFHPTDRLNPEPAEWAERALELPGAARHPLAVLAHLTAGWGAQQAARSLEALRHGLAAIALAERHAPEQRWIAHYVALGGALYSGDMVATKRHLELIVPTARETGDDYVVSRALWAPIMLARALPTGIDVGEAVAEALDLARRRGAPSMLARGHILSGVVRGPTDPAGAIDDFAVAEEHARLARSPYLIGFAMAYTAGAMSSVDPVGAFQRVLDTLEWHRGIGAPMGIARITLRDLLPSLAAAGQHRLVALLDAHLPAVSFFQFDEVLAAVDEAHRALGPEFAHAQAEGRDATASDVLAALQEALQTLLGRVAPNARGA